MKNYFLFLSYLSLIFFGNNACASETAEKFKWVCEVPTLDCNGNHDNCNLYLNKNAESETLVLLSDRDIMCRTTIKDQNEELSEIVTSCGSSCTVSTFYDVKTHEKSPPYHGIIAVKPEKQLAISVDKDGVKLISIFNKQPSLLLIPKKQLSSKTAFILDAIDSATFKNNKIYMEYVDQNDNEKIKIFSLK